MKLKILNGDSYWMAQYADADGNVWLDIDDEFSVKYNKEIESLTDLNKINIEAVLGTALVATPKNENLIGQPAKLAVYKNEYVDFEIQLIHGLKIYNQSKIRILGKKESLKPGSQPNYEVELLDTTNHWAIQFNKMYLNELPFPDFEYSADNLWNSFNLDASYTHGDNGYWFPLVNYGGWYDNRVFTLTDFRPWVHDAKVFELAFKKAEWQFSCPLLESNVGKRLISYVLAENFDNDEGIKLAKGFKATTDQNVIYHGGKKPVYAHVIFENELEDKSNLYNPTTSVYSAPIVAAFYAEIDVFLDIHETTIGNVRASIIFELVKVLADGTEIEIGGIAKYEKNAEDFHGEEHISLASGELTLYNGESVYVRFRGHGKGLCNAGVLKNSTFSCDPIRNVRQEGDIFSVQKALRKDKVLDFVKGCAHLFNWKFYTDFAAMKVYILTPYDVDFFGDSLAGFFQDTVQDFTAYIDISDHEIKVPHEEKKNIYYKFKDSSDPFITNLKLDKDKQLFSNFIDNGFDFDDETIKEENPYFEPTANNIEQLRGSLLDMPIVWDNPDGIISYKINPRKLIAAGMTDQFNYVALDYFKEAGSNNSPYAAEFVTPYAYQFANAKVFNGTTYVTVTEYLIYGKAEFDLFNLCYKKYNNEFKNCNTVQVNTIANYDKIESIDFRKRAYINVKGTGQYGRFLSVANFDPDKNEGVILFKADNTTDPTSSIYTAANQCENFPDILITPLGSGSYSISAVGTNASGVTSTVIEWRYFDTPTWTTGSTFSTTSKKVYCRITWDYSDDCQTLQRTGSVDPCGNYPKLCAERTFPEPYTLNVYECGTHSETPTGYLYEFSTNNIAWNIIPDPFLLSDLPETTYLRVTVYYANCPPKTAELIYVNQSSYDDCSYDGLYVPSVAFVTSPAGLTIERKGFFTGSVANDIVWFRKVGSDEEWDLYDNTNREILSTENGVNWEAYRVVMFCNEDCPIYCSSVVTANNDCAGSAEIIDSSQLALFEVMWENPDTAANTWKAEIEDDSDTFVPVLRAYLDEDLGGSHTELFSRTVQWSEWNFKTEFLWTWSQTDSVKLFKISRNVAGVQTLGLNVDINVQFQTGATNDELKTLLENAIYSAMFNTYSAVDGVDYDVIITITGSGSTRSAGVAFVAKNVVASTWFGPNATSDYLQTITTGMTTTNHASSKKEFQRVITPAPIATFHSPCGSDLKVRFKVSLATQFVDDSASNFDTIVMNSTITIVDEVVTAVSDSCQKHSLSLSLTGITTPTYTWKKGRKILGTDSTVITYGNNQIRCIVGDSDGCYYMAEVNQ